MTYGAMPSASTTFLKRPKTEQREADRNVVRCRSGKGSPLELRHHLAEVHDRAGDELRKEQHEQRELAQRERLDPAGVDVDQERDLLERDERDAERQDRSFAMTKSVPARSFNVDCRKLTYLK